MTTDRPDHVPILMYHSVSRTSARLDHRFTLPPRVFASHVEALADWGANTMTVDAYVDLLRAGRSAPPRTVVITIDDGYDDTATSAFPMLSEAGFTATVFVTSGTVDSIVRESRMISWEQVHELHHAGFEIGSHAVRHVALDIVTAPRAEDELRRSKEVLEDALRAPVNSFAYPYSYHTRAIERLASSCGYRSASAAGDTLCTPTSPRFALPRILVSRTVDAAQLRAIVDGRSVGVQHGERTLVRTGWRMVRRARARAFPEPDQIRHISTEVAP